jgi:glycosyltransferase involved in cell wall biosynthesis
MRIAQVAPLYESVPPRLYGGTERVVSHLTEELVRMGHDVTLFASGDSVTAARLIPICPRALRLDAGSIDVLAHHVRLLEEVFRRRRSFDLVHFHIDYLHFPLSRRVPLAQLTTLHGRLDLPDLKPLYAEYDDMPVVSISDAQREPLPYAHWLGTVYHGLPRDLYPLCEEAEDYVAFLGRISPEKRVDRAVEIARRTGRTLRIAAKVDRVDEAYFRDVAEPLVREPFVDFLGEVGDVEKRDLLGRARALIFPIDWPEPFGLVMIEALACGTPVIAFRGGSVAEVIEDGVTGFLVDDLDGAVRALERIDQIDRRVCRSVFEARFSVERMAHDYVALYETLCGGRRRAIRRAALPMAATVAEPLPEALCAEAPIGS